jgi:branched-chain amino acid transport system permease protein
MNIFRGNSKKLTLYLLAGIFLVVLPLFVDAYVLYIFNLIGIAVILALGLNLVMGYAGQISLSHGAFFGMGAYGTAILIEKLGFSFWVALPLGGILAAVVGIIIGLPALRVGGHYLALVTLGANEIFNLILIHSESLTKGVMGLKMARPSIGSFSLEDIHFFYLILVISCVLTWVAQNIIKSQFGRAFNAIRQSETAAQAIAINLFEYKLIAFALSAFYAGIAGGLYGSFIKFIDPTNFDLFLSIKYLIIVIVGGLGSISGSLIGAIIMTLLPELFRAFGDYQHLIYGFILLFFVIFLPRGIIGIWNSLFEKYFEKRQIPGKMVTPVRG